jgi:Transposase
MAVKHFFTQALGLASPWKVITCDFDPVAKTQGEQAQEKTITDGQDLQRLEGIQIQNRSVCRPAVPAGKSYRLYLSPSFSSVVEISLEINGKETFSEFIAELNRRGVAPSQVEEIAMDMSRAFIAGASEHFPDAQISFDRFHVMILCGESLDEIRKQVSREFLADLWNYQTRGDAEPHLGVVICWCCRSRMQPFVKLGKTLKRHMDGILGYFNNYTTSAVIEAINGLLQLARRRARGYQTFRKFQAMAYWIAGGLTIQTCPISTH